MPMFRSVSRIRQLKSREEESKAPLTRKLIEKRQFTRLQVDNSNRHEFRSVNKSCEQSRWKSQSRRDATATAHRPTRNPIRNQQGNCVKPEICNRCNRRVPTSTLRPTEDCDFKVERLKLKKSIVKCPECECEPKMCTCNARNHQTKTCDFDELSKRKQKSSKVLDDPFPRQIKYNAVLIATRKK